MAHKVTLENGVERFEKEDETSDELNAKGNDEYEATQRMNSVHMIARFLSREPFIRGSHSGGNKRNRQTDCM